MPSSFDARLARIEKYAPVVANGDRLSPFPMIQAFVDDNGGRLGGESYAEATARLLEISPRNLLAYLEARADGSEIDLFL
jgi:hypothetical protein